MRKSVAYNICMKTDFFRKKAFILAGILSIATVLSGIFYAHALTRTVEVNIGESFYFLISEEDNVAASAEEVYLGGGEGYVMSRAAQIMPYTPVILRRRMRKPCEII